MGLIVISQLLDHDLEDFLKVLSVLRLVDKSKEEVVTIFKRRMDAGIHTFVCKVDGNIVGTASVFFEEKYYGTVAHVEDVVVRKEFQRQGIGKSMMLFFEKMAKKRGCYKIVLACSQDNIDFYQSLGYLEKDKQMRKDL